MSYFKLVSFLISSFLFNILYSQNLFPNSDFEIFTECPNSQSTFEQKILTDWFCPLEGASPDYFNQCGKDGKNGIPVNMMGYQNANSGKGYVGIWAIVPKTNYREYIACRLIQPLEKDKVYHIEFHVSLSNESSYFLNTLDFAFTDILPYSPDKRMYALLKKKSFQSEVNLKDTAQWMKISADYKANGDEKYFMMGYLEFGIKKTSYEKLDYKPEGKFIVWKGAYYYIDSIEIIENISDTILPDTSIVVKPDSLMQDVLQEATKGFVLDRVYFDVDKSVIKPESFSQLDSVVLLMNLYPDISIEISGHTDSTASVKHNEELSRNRANAVRQYLIDKGISPDRMTAKGYASTKPRDTNKTPEGRARNRRVEFVVKEK